MAAAGRRGGGLGQPPAGDPPPARELVRPSVTELSQVRTNILCTVPGCGKVLPNSPALNMHLSKAHRLQVPPGPGDGRRAPPLAGTRGAPGLGPPPGAAGLWGGPGLLGERISRGVSLNPPEEACAGSCVNAKACARRSGGLWRIAPQPCAEYYPLRAAVQRSCGSTKFGTRFLLLPSAHRLSFCCLGGAPAAWAAAGSACRPSALCPASAASSGCFGSW